MARRTTSLELSLTPRRYLCRISSPDHAETKAKLEGLSTEQHDLAHMKSHIVDHQKTSQLLRWEIGSGEDAEMQRFADDILPTVLEHLAHAQQILADLAGAKPVMTGVMPDRLLIARACRGAAMRRILVVSDYCDGTVTPDGAPSIEEAAAWRSGEHGPLPDAAPSLDISFPPAVIGGYLERLPLAALCKGLCDTAEIWSFWAHASAPPWTWDPSTG